MTVKTERIAVYAGAIALSIVFAAPATADPSAIVEDIEAAGADIGFMDYVEPGDELRLGDGERLVLGYFASCTQETIIGGTVTVGTTQSEVAGGSVKRAKVECDAGQVQLNANQSNASGVVAFRDAGSSNSR
jgi:hypothetical protein